MSLNRRFAARLYALTLLAFPARHRAQFRDEMIDAFDQEVARRSVNAGTWASVRFAVTAYVNAVSAGVGERRRNRRRQRGSGFVFRPDIVGRDLLHATRALWKAKGFTLVCSLSLGIGMGTVIAALVLLRMTTAAPKGVTADGLVELLIAPQGALLDRSRGEPIETWSYPDFEDVRRANTGMTVTGWTTGQRTVRVDGAGIRTETMYVSPNYFTTVGAPLALGRGFDPETRSLDDALVEVPRQAVVSHLFWQNRLGSNPGIIGSSLVVNGADHVVVGVAMKDYRGHFSQQRPGFDLWLPLSEHPRLAVASSARLDRDVDWLRVLGRLSPDSSVFEADAAVSSIMTGLAQQFPATNSLKRASVKAYFPMGARQRGDGLLLRAITLGASKMILLVVCLNITGMMLVRAATRERELAVRLAMGASRGRLIVYLLSEALVLATLGGAIGAAVIFGTPAVLKWWFQLPPDPELAMLNPDRWIVLYCAGLCFVTSLVFGLLPAVRFSRPTLVTALKDDAAGGGRRVSRVHRLTAAVQAGLAVPFLVTGGVLLDQMRTTANAKLGFEPAEIVAVPLDLTSASRSAGDPGLVLRSAQTRLERAAGVQSVTTANGMPLDGQWVGREARVSRSASPPAVSAHTTRVAPGYFDTMGISVIRGRAIDGRDVASSEPVAVISEALETQLFPDKDALGQRITFGLEGDANVDVRWPQQALPSAAKSYTVVGVAGDTAASHLGAVRPQLFVSLAQQPAARVYLIARTSATTSVMASAVEDAVTGIFPDPDAVRAGLFKATDLLRSARTELTLGSTLAGAVGVIALTLAALGVFGVIGFMVATRTREIGIRIALGATRSRVFGTVLGDALKLALPGVTMGLLIAVFVVKEISWYSLGVVEPALYITAAGAALAVALLAGLPAARRAAAVEPLIAMRSE